VRRNYDQKRTGGCEVGGVSKALLVCSVAGSPEDEAYVTLRGIMTMGWSPSPPGTSQ